jgi:hypothetical protein
MTQDLIRYDVLVQEALRGVVRKIIGEVVKAGLPGQHHFYVSFDTHPGVRMSTRLRQRYPTEMTVVLQHQFWDLNVSEVAFEVGLSFSGIPERLYIPFNAIKGFFDPSVQFGLEFQPVRDGEAASDAAEPATTPQSGQQPGGVVQSLPSRTQGLRLAETDSRTTSGPGEATQSNSAGETPPPERAKPNLKSVPTATPENPGGSTVVSIDSFRKKP